MFNLLPRNVSLILLMLDAAIKYVHRLLLKNNYSDILSKQYSFV